MLSFTSILTVAVALMSVSPALANSPIDASAHLLAKRARPHRPNHADLYGYPHGRGDHSGSRGAVPQNNTPMTPGGYKDPRPANEGAECSKNAQCSTGITNARGVCTGGKCTYACLGRTTFDGTSCTGSIVSRRCSFNRQCTTNVENASGVCDQGYCTFGCDSGFYANGSTCKTADKTCGDTACPTIVNGYTTCSGDTCSPHCNGNLGYQMYCSADNSYCTCTNTRSDALNCGAPGNVCPGGYNGKGRAYCSAGTCQLSCYRLTKVTPTDGSAAYCA